MKKIQLLVAILALTGCSHPSSAQTLKESLGKYFFVGTSLNQWQSDGQDAAATAVVGQHFNAAVAENCMKSECLQPAEGVFDFRTADKFVDYCQQNRLTAFGHCLVWHSQAPDWLFTDSYGHLVSREKLAQRLRSHIATVVGHFKGKIHGWDVVNEAIEDDGSFRQSPLYKILGEEFIDIAFEAAHKADPDAELYYNDYSMAGEKKREAVCRLVKRLKAKGLRVDAIGMQSHNGLDYPNLAEYEKSIDAFAACGVKVMVTELDINVLPNPQQFGGADVSQNFEYQQKLNPYTNGLPKEKVKELDERWLALFDIYYRHRHQISRINLWGIADHNSWLNGWPIAGRTNYPLLFDRQYQPKAVVKEIVKRFAK